MHLQRKTEYHEGQGAFFRMHILLIIFKESRPSLALRRVGCSSPIPGFTNLFSLMIATGDPVHVIFFYVLECMK